MSKSSNAFLLLPFVLLAAMWAYTSAGRATQKANADLMAASRDTENEIFAERQENRRLFLLLMDPVLNDLSEGKLTLRMASEKLILDSMHYHGEYLTNVLMTERGATPLESMARNCLRHLRLTLGDEKQGERGQLVLQGLEHELAAITNGETAK